MDIKTAIFAVAIALNATALKADGSASASQAEFVFDGVPLSISTGFPQAATYAARFAALKPSCNPDCLGGAASAKGVETLIEPEVLQFLATAVGQNNGLLVDARMPQSRALGFIPGSVSLPFPTVAPDNEFREEILKALGARAFEDVFNFADAQSLVVFDNGPTQDDAKSLIGHLIGAGYPPEKIRYYRGGMQVWSVLGLTIQE